MKRRKFEMFCLIKYFLEIKNQKGNFNFIALQIYQRKHILNRYQLMNVKDMQTCQHSGFLECVE